MDKTENIISTNSSETQRCATKSYGPYWHSKTLFQMTTVIRCTTLKSTYKSGILWELNEGTKP